MFDFPVALQLYSVINEVAADFEGTLKKVKEIGYDGVEFVGLFGKSAAEVKKLCTEIGLNPISAHVPYVDMVNDNSLLDVYSEIGCKFIVIPQLLEEYRPGTPGFGDVIENIKLLGAKANSLGMKLCYHNHEFEFEKIDGEYALDKLYREIPSEFLFTEIDTCWVNVGGENPAKYIRKYSGRADIVHLKDFVGSRDEKEGTAGSFEFRPIGMGVQDFPAILAASKDAGAKWVVVEQDSPCLDKTPLECAEISVKYIKSIY